MPNKYHCNLLQSYIWNVSCARVSILTVDRGKYLGCLQMGWICISGGDYCEQVYFKSMTFSFYILNSKSGWFIKQFSFKIHQLFEWLHKLKAFVKSGIHSVIKYVMIQIQLLSRVHVNTGYCSVLHFFMNAFITVKGLKPNGLSSGLSVWRL